MINKFLAYGYQEVEGYVFQKVGFERSLKVILEMVHTQLTHQHSLDTTSLSHSRINNDGKLRKADGGVSNTEDFSSYSISLSGKNFSH